MEEQRKFRTQLFGFAKDAVLSYIYEQDAEAKLREEQILGENREMLAAIDTLKARLKEASAQIEEANSQYEILKAQLYNEKKTAQDKQEAYDRLSREARELESAARQRENELQLQNELNKQLQVKLAQQQSELEMLRQQAAVRAVPAEPAPQFTEAVPAPQPAQTVPEPEAVSDPVPAQQGLGSLREELSALRESFSRQLAGFESLLSGFSGQKQQAQEPEPPAQQDRFFH